MSSVEWRKKKTENNVEEDPFKEIRCSQSVEVGNQAFWSVSSCKPGFGVDQLRDRQLDTYWQSDGQLPHLVSIQFNRKMTVTDVSIYMDYKLDESYTPNRLSVRAGSSFNDLMEIEFLELNEPSGWVTVSLKDAREGKLRTFLLQVAVLSNHQNGRDCHIRQMLVHSPAEDKAPALTPVPGHKGNFVTVDFLQHLTIR